MKRPLNRLQQGFTLIELMVVIVIIGILVAIALPNFIGSTDRAKITAVKANMHTFQTIVETYAVDWGGMYPSDVATLRQEAMVAGREYWKDFNNPFSATSGEGGSYDDAAIATITAAGASGLNSTSAGLTLYGPVTTGASITTYYLYGLDKAGQVIRDRGQNFTLSNG